jgi:very-short-patch-repair endonuclease
MKVNSGKEAMKLLTNSYRIYEDLKKNTSFGEKNFKSKIMLREWIEEVSDNPQYEFRSFVSNRSLNAVSQYFCDSYFDDLYKENEQERIKKLIVDFFDKEVKDKIQHESYVIDFIILKSRVLVIELNPFHIGGIDLINRKPGHVCFLGKMIGIYS